MKNKLNIDNVIGVILILMTLGIIALIIYFSHASAKYTSTTYQLDELNNGVYAIYYTTHSKTPAYNYEIVTLNCNGNIYTFEGNVQISYLKDNTSPYVVYKNCNIVYADKILVYVPEGTVEYQSSVRVG